MKDRLRQNNILALSTGFIYIWFGALKFFPSLSPAEDLAKQTIDILTFYLIPSNISIILLAIWEFLVGICLFFNLWRRTAVKFALIHMILTFTPLIFFPNLVFGEVPFQLTLVGQYIIKNVVIIAGLLILLKSPDTKE